jgi:CBS domain-containing protein
MAVSVRDVMTSRPVTCETSTSIEEAARLMRDRDIGDVLVCDGDVLRGIVTDRDIVVRCVAGGADVSRSTVGDVCTGDVMSVSPDTSVEDAARAMREGAVRRLPVVEGGRAIGIVSLGDLAVELGGQTGGTSAAGTGTPDPGEVLADISAAEPNV